MNSLPANLPDWLSKKINKSEGEISFYDYMDMVLYDPSNGYYGSGKANIGIKGDYVTSPSLSSDFSELLALQIEDWYIQLAKEIPEFQKIEILEFGSGNGSLINGIIKYFQSSRSLTIKNLSFKIIDFNEGMRKKQKENLIKYIKDGIDIAWISLEDLKKNSFDGIVIAHEVLDAFPVERIEFSKGRLYRQGVSINNETKKLSFSKLPMTKYLKDFIKNAKTENGVEIVPKDVQDGWSTEIHVDNIIWLENLYSVINNGILLIIDYALDSKRYYSSQKNQGTLVSYKNQNIFEDIFFSPGNCDLTSHLCIDLLVNQAKKIGFDSLGVVKQGEALLLLGLAEKLHNLQNEFNNDLSQALLRREALLRLVDPVCLGDFKWFIFSKMNRPNTKISSRCIS